LISCISHFFKNIKENLKFLIPIGIGMVLSILVLSNVISYTLEHYPVPTTLFFVGLILGGIPLLTKKIKGNEKSYFNDGCCACFRWMQQDRDYADDTRGIVKGTV
jgi:uncharacterized membrane protein